MLEIGDLMKLNHKERFYQDFEALKNKMETHNQYQPVLYGKDLQLYEELLEFRRDLAKKLGWPLCNIFLNRDAQSLVINKPMNKSDFISIPGFKERKYMLFGEDIISIINKYIDEEK